MNFKAFQDFCEEFKIEYKTDEPMRNHTSFKIGGNADLFISVTNEQQLSGIIKITKSLNIPYFILGKGSNILVSDKGVEGVVISLLKMDEISVEGDNIVAFAGASLAAVCLTAAKNSLSGLEFAYGIPASVGGALFMNAGAYGGEISQAVSKAYYVDGNGEIGEISVEDMLLGYRTSIFKKGDMIITRVVFSLKSGDYRDINSSMNDYLNRRREKQPLEFPSAGSTFKRPQGYFAGQLIEQNGLKGYRVGGAAVSEKHAGFIINYDNATCDDVKKLIGYVSDTVYKNDKVRLEPEVIFVGRNK